VRMYEYRGRIPKKVFMCKQRLFDLKKVKSVLTHCTAGEPCVLHEADLGPFAYSFNMSVDFAIRCYDCGESSVRGVFAGNSI